MTGKETDRFVMFLNEARLLSDTIRSELKFFFLETGSFEELQKVPAPVKLTAEELELLSMDPERHPDGLLTDELLAALGSLFVAHSIDILTITLMLCRRCSSDKDAKLVEKVLEILKG